jgi:WD40 repeat protein
MQNGSHVTFVMFSQDGSRVVSGSHDNTVRIWNATMGEVEAELKGHMGWVMSVAFAQAAELSLDRMTTQSGSGM